MSIMFHKQHTFGIKDYWNMFRKRGLRLPINYFLNAHLFDIMHRTDTHTWLPKEDFTDTPPNFAHGVLYMVSWTHEIQRSFQRVRLLVPDFATRTFIDIGCGKGKVVLVWQQLLQRIGLRQHVIGIDYYQPFIDIAQQNHHIVFGTTGQFLYADATTLDYTQFGNAFIVYLYNPFDDTILTKVLDVLAPFPTIIIYNNPVHHDVLLTHQYHVIDEHMGFHPNCQTRIYERIPHHIE